MSTSSPCPQDSRGSSASGASVWPRDILASGTRPGRLLFRTPRNPNYPDLIYRTGDLAVMDEAGLFTFLTRQDGQIKHMGYRIELGEIETVLNSIPSMEEVACLFDPERDRIHCVYTGSQESKDIAKLARASLPRYMVPNLYHKVAVMPHNPNGKIDRPKLKEEWIHGNDHRL